MKDNQYIKDLGIVGLIAALFFIPFLGGVHLFDWDEINFAECAREMMVVGNYSQVILDYQPFWEKPPLFIWMQVISMKIFGVNEFAARYPNAICGVVTLLTLYYFGRKLFDREFAWLWVATYFGSILPHLYFRSGIIDPWFNYFIFMGISFFIFSYWKRNEMKIDQQKSTSFYLVLGGLFLGLAIMTKGPVAYLITLLTVGIYWLLHIKTHKKLPFHFIKFSLFVGIIPILWLGIETARNGTWFVEEFFTYQIRLAKTQDAGHGGFFGYHFVVLLIGCFPASLLAIPSFIGIPTKEITATYDYRRWMLILFWVVLILFSIVQSKIVHYSSMCYFPLTFLAAFSLYYRLYLRKKISLVLLVLVGLFISVIITMLPLVGQNIDLIKPMFEKDKFALANLDAAVHWQTWEVLIGTFLTCVTIIGFMFLQFKKVKKGVITLFGGTAIFLFLALVTFANKIESYSQNAAIEFYKSKANEDCYILPIGHKSYAHLFYSQKRPVIDDRTRHFNYLTKEKLIKPAYFITKINRQHHLIGKGKNVEKLYEKNGFVFWKRSADE